MTKTAKWIISMFFSILLLLMILVPATNAARADAAEKMPYLIKVNRACNTVTVYTQDENGKFDVPVKAMICSVGKGSRTITGTFRTKESYRWKLLNGHVYGQYATRIVGGILFHSVYYYQNGNPATLATNEYNKLGTAASHGCIRLTVEDAKWIYDNCAAGSEVMIYDDRKNPGPLGKPEPIRIASTVRWDPTDPSLNNPYRDKTPLICGIKNVKIEWGNDFDIMKGITAKSSVGTDITSKISVEGNVDYNKPGLYQVTYSVKDSLGKITRETRFIRIEEPSKPPVFEGICDKVINGETVVDEAFALEGVEAYSNNKKIKSDNIKVVIDQIDEDHYSIIYQIVIGKKVKANETSNVTIDREAPVINGVQDLNYPKYQIPVAIDVLYGITASDNYSSEENITLNADIIDNLDGTYKITYTAVDEAGNITTVYANIYTS